MDIFPPNFSIIFHGVNFVWGRKKNNNRTHTVVVQRQNAEFIKYEKTRMRMKKSTHETTRDALK